jgi:hypothetical protein
VNIPTVNLISTFENTISHIANTSQLDYNGTAYSTYNSTGIKNISDLKEPIKFLKKDCQEPTS